MNLIHLKGVLSYVKCNNCEGAGTVMYHSSPKYTGACLACEGNGFYSHTEFIERLLTAAINDKESGLIDEIQRM